MLKSPVRELFDALMDHQELVVHFPSVEEMQKVKVRLHQIRKEMDDQMRAIGEPQGIFGDKAICFLPTNEPDYEPNHWRICLVSRNAPKRAAFTIIQKGSQIE